MSAQILDGRATAAAIKNELAERVALLAERGITPGLGTVLVGDDPGSHAYVAGKHRDCAEVGVSSIRIDLSADVGQDDLDDQLRRLNADPACTGYIVQLPLPDHLDEQRALELMDPAKDADGLHPINLGRLVLNVGSPLASPLPCTPRGIIELLSRHGISLQGKEVVVLGRGVTVGRPMGLLLTRKAVNATTTLCHTGTHDIGEHLRRADVVIAAAGVAHIVTPGVLKEGVILLDVGVTREENPETGKARLLGDIEPECAEVASWISPNPGGVGPMTRAMLLANVVEAAERQAGTNAS